MTDDTEFGTLPRFSRDIAVLSGWVSNRDTGVRDHGVLPPFSGVLDTRIERGRAPMLDLSYLTLEPLVASGLSRPAGRRTETIAPSDIEREPTATDADADEEREPTVREVIYGDSGDRTDEHTLDTGRLSSDVEGPSLTRLSTGSERPDSWPDDRSDTHRGQPRSRSGEPSESARGAPRDAPSDQSPDVPDGRRDASPRTTVDRSGSADTPTRRERDERSVFRGTGTVDRLSRADSPTRTVVDRSGTSFEPGDRLADTRSPSAGDAVARPGVPPPRMVTEGATGDTVQRSSGRSAPGESTPRVPGQSRTGEAGSESGPGPGPGPGEAARASGSPSTDRGTADDPRMVVDRSGATGSDVDSASTAGVDDRSAPPADQGVDLSDRTVDSDDTLATIREASRDPESELIDRLYRTLREREAIERRRRGGR